MAIARSSDAGRRFATRTVPGTLWSGQVCTRTRFCDVPPGSASPFLENFGIAMDPRTGLSSTAYAGRSPARGQPPTSIAYASELARTPQRSSR